MQNWQFIFTIVVVLGVGCTSRPRGDFYEGIPHTAEYPKSEASLRAALARGDFHSLRRHAWSIFAAMTAPADQDRAIPRWETWFDIDDVFPQNAPGVLPPRQLRGWLQTVHADPETPAVVVDRLKDRPATVVLYNREARDYIINNRLYLKSTLRCMQQGEDIEFPPEAIVLKAEFFIIGRDIGQELGVWNAERPIPGEVSSHAPNLPDKVCVANSRSKCAFSTAQFHPLSEFYYVDLRTLPAAWRRDLLQRLTADKLLDDGEQADYLVLDAFHFATKEQKEWVWATFWWHDRPEVGPFAEGRPILDVRSPWNHYLMQISYDMDFPREPDGGPHIAFNPYLEGYLPEGVQSNCMSCHRRSVWDEPGQPDTEVLHMDGSSTPPLPFEDIVVRGRTAATATYLDTPFERQRKLGFLWTLRNHAVDGPGPPAPCEPKP